MATVGGEVMHLHSALLVQGPRCVQRPNCQLLERSASPIMCHPRDNRLLERGSCDERLGQIAVKEVVGGALFGIGSNPQPRCWAGCADGRQRTAGAIRGLAIQVDLQTLIAERGGHVHPVPQPTGHERFGEVQPFVAEQATIAGVRADAPQMIDQ